MEANVWINWGLHILALKVDEFIISIKGKVINNPPLRDENSDF
jgi:hypothetical protein